MLTREETRIKAIRPNAGVEAAYRGALQALVREIAQSMLIEVREAYKREAPAIGFASDSSDILRDTLNRWAQIWEERIEPIATGIAHAFAHRSSTHLDAAFRKVLRDAGFTVRFQATQGMAEAFRAVLAENVNLIKSIPSKFLTEVQTAVWQAVMKGSTLGTLSQTIQARYGVTYRRAALIARDQSAKAKAVMEQARRSELGITEAIWMHSHAGKEPRPTHVRMNGKRYKIKVGMWDSAEGEFVWPGTLINCRCTSRAILP